MVGHAFILAILLCLTTLASAEQVVRGQQAAEIRYTVTGFCQNSLRVQISTNNIKPGSNITLNHPGALLVTNNVLCPAQEAVTLTSRKNVHTHDNLRVELTDDQALKFWNVKTSGLLFQIDPVSFKPSAAIPGLVATSISTKHPAGDTRVYGLGQGGWTASDGSGCAGGNGTEHIVPLLRNGQSVNLLQRKFHISIPFVYSTDGEGSQYGLLYNHGGYGDVAVDEQGGQVWSQQAALNVDLWVTTTKARSEGHRDIYEHYADATGHSPSMREDAMSFWQSRNRYKSSDIVESLATRYAGLDVRVGVVVVDFKNMNFDGDFQPGQACYPDLSALVSNVRSSINATTMFSFWPEVLPQSAEYQTLAERGCLINIDLQGLAFDATQTACRDYAWNKLIKPRYFDHGVNSFWLDETDGEGTGTPQPNGKDGNGQHGYDTSYGPAAFASNYWVNDWISMFSSTVQDQGMLPLVLTRGVWAGGQRLGAILWSADIESTFEELTAQVNLGVHSGLAGIPWWTSDVGGYGCGDNSKGKSLEYVQELMIRWYQFGCFSPIFRTHGCRPTADPDPDTDTCSPPQPSCGANEIWTWGDETQAVLSKYVVLREKLKPYIAEINTHVQAKGSPVVRALWWEFPTDAACLDVDDQFMLGSALLVAPVTRQGVTSRSVYFPKGANWVNIFDGTVVAGGSTKTVDAPLEIIPVYKREGHSLTLLP